MSDEADQFTNEAVASAQPVTSAAWMMFSIAAKEVATGMEAAKEALQNGEITPEEAMMQGMMEMQQEIEVPQALRGKPRWAAVAMEMTSCGLETWVSIVPVDPEVWKFGSMFAARMSTLVDEQGVESTLTGEAPLEALKGVNDIFGTEDDSELSVNTLQAMNQVHLKMHMRVGEICRAVQIMQLPLDDDEDQG